MDLNTALLERLSIPAIYERGERYYQTGRVVQLVGSEGKFEACVRGSRDYHPFIDLSGDAWVGTCTCPYAGEGICKHLVAAGLAILTGQVAETNAQELSGNALQVSPEEVRESLLRQIKNSAGNPLESDADLLRYWGERLEMQVSAGRIQDGLRLLMGVYEAGRVLGKQEGRDRARALFAALEPLLLKQLNEAELPVADRKSGIEWIFRRWDKYESAYDGVSKTAIRYEIGHFEALLIALSSEKVTAHYASMKLQAYGLMAEKMPILHEHILRIQ